MFTIHVDRSDLERHCRELNDFIEHETVPIFHLEAKERITENTFNGRDWRNKDFVPYTYGYALQRKNMGLSGAPVDLSITGGMIDSIDLRGNTTGPSPDEMEKAVKLEKGESPLNGPREFVGIDEEGLTIASGQVEIKITKRFSNA